MYQFTLMWFWYRRKIATSLLHINEKWNWEEVRWFKKSNLIVTWQPRRIYHATWLLWKPLTHSLYRIHSFIHLFLRFSFHKNSKYFFSQHKSLSFIVAVLKLSFYQINFKFRIQMSHFHDLRLCDVMLWVLFFLNVFLIVVIYLWILRDFDVAFYYKHTNTHTGRQIYTKCNVFLVDILRL